MKEQAKTKISSLMSKIERFVESDWFIVFNAVFVLLGWCLDIWSPMLCVLVALNVLPLFFFRSTRHLIGLVMMFMQIVSTNRHSLESYFGLFALIPVALFGLIVNVVRFKPSFKMMRKRKIRGFHLCLLLLVIPFAFGGVGSETENVLALLGSLALIVVVGLAYTFFFATNVNREDKSTLMDYIVKVLAMMGLITAIECLVVIAQFDGSIKDVIIYVTQNRLLDIGWAGPNNIGIVLAMTIPATLYLCIKKNYATPLFVAFAFLQLALVFITASRGSILCAGAMLIPAILYVMVKTKNKLLFGGSVTLLVVAIVLLFVQNGDLLQVFLSRFINSGLDSNGRTDGLFLQAIDLFKQHPIFGVGWDYNLGGLTTDNYTPYWFHSTALQILANMGVVGVLFFVPFYFFRYTIFLRQAKTSASACALLAATLVFEAYGMMDVLYFAPTFFIMMVFMTMVAEISLPERMTKMERYSLTLNEFEYQK